MHTMLPARDLHAMSARKLAVTVLLGGPSAEREVSLQSGAAMAAALRRCGHSVRECDIGPHDLSALEHPCDVVMIGLHGGFGEDGTLQRILEQRGIPFTGSGSRASAIAMNKLASKRAATEIGLRTAVSWHVRPDDLGVLAPLLRPPIVIKPVDAGSSVATHVIRADAARIVPALGDVLERFGEALVEEFIDGQELTVAILDGRALPPVLIRPRAGFYDYHAKYLAEDTEYLFEALPAAVLELAQRQSLALFERIGCRHLARVDWIVDAAGTPWFLEVNTLPGFTSHSLVPKAAARSGVPFDELCERLVRLALEDGR